MVISPPKHTFHYIWYVYFQCVGHMLFVIFKIVYVLEKSHLASRIIHRRCARRWLSISDHQIVFFFWVLIVENWIQMTYLWTWGTTEQKYDILTILLNMVVVSDYHEQVTDECDLNKLGKTKTNLKLHLSLKDKKWK